MGNWCWRNIVAWDSSTLSLEIPQKGEKRNLRSEGLLRAFDLFVFYLNYSYKMINTD